MAVDKVVGEVQLTRLATNIKNKFVQKVNNVAVDPATGNVTLGSDTLAYGDSNVKAALDAINDKINYVKINIDSLTNTVGTVEKGTKVRDVDIIWALNKAVLKEATLNGVALTAGELKARKKHFSYPAPTSGTDPALVSDTNFRLIATDTHGASAQKDTGIWFQNKKYWGVGNPADDAINSAFILGLTGKSFASNFRGDFNVNAGADQYIYFAFPTAWGTPRFVVGGFEGGFIKAKTVDFTNASGYTESYDIYRTGKAGLGNTTVTVQ